MKRAELSYVQCEYGQACNQKFLIAFLEDLYKITLRNPRHFLEGSPCGNTGGILKVSQKKFPKESENEFPEESQEKHMEKSVVEFLIKITKKFLENPRRNFW